MPQFLSAMDKIPDTELVRTINALRSDAFRMWQWQRTGINVKVLADLDHPDDADRWSLLRDVLDIVETTQEYRDELEEQFEEFLDNTIYDFYDLIDQAEDDDDIDLHDPLDELTKLDELADRWGVTTDASDLIYQISVIEERRDAVAAEQRRPQHDQNQLTLMEFTEATPKPSATIFDHL